MPKYISPYSLLQIESDTAIDKSVLSLARKKMLAELDLSENQTLMIGANEFTKNDVIVFFDELSKNTDFEVHQTIYQHKQLSSFLESGTLPNNITLIDKPLSDFNHDFIEYVSPYFSDIYNEKIKTAFAQKDNRSLTILLGLTPKFLKTTDLFTANSIIDLELSKLISLAKSMDYDVEHGNTKNVGLLLNQHFPIAFINALSRMDVIFDEKKDELAIAFNNLSIELWNNTQQDAARYAAYRALEMATNPETITMVKKLVEQVARTNSNKYSSAETSSSSNSSSGMAVVVRFIIFMLILLRSALTCNHSSPRIPNYLPPMAEDRNYQRYYSTSNSGDLDEIKSSVEDLDATEYGWKDQENVEEIVHNLKNNIQSTEKYTFDQTIDPISEVWKTIKNRIGKNIPKKKMTLGLKEEMAEVESLLKKAKVIMAAKNPDSAHEVRSAEVAPDLSLVTIKTTKNKKNKERPERKLYLDELKRIKESMKENQAKIYYLSNLLTLKNKYPKEIDQNYRNLFEEIMAKKY